MSESAAPAALFCCGEPVSTSPENTLSIRNAAGRLIVAANAAMVKDAMVTDQIKGDIGRFTARIVIDDRSRLPGRFFGRFATSAT
ncbi:hypothetical protein [Nitrobacter sp.]|uniref:hypothetical protein n=1 Tax=unclassified Nitrobacter TaxID=2620411 RepID=UPI002CA1BF96|nr:hypothetical protein [Nitrobacter sp.]